MMAGRGDQEWKQDEWAQIEKRRARAFRKQRETPREGSGPDSPTEHCEPKNIVGLAVSGGGIRSALYNDGFLQGLSHRGFLRYVDYICSVSGGGYIAGHLISQARADQSGPCFHDDPDRRDLGRDPATGEVDAKRLAGIGGYLSRTFEFLPAYLWSFLFSFAFYIGAVGVLATLAALFWRSFDDPMFRELYSNILGLKAGGELMIAFIPAILLILLYAVCEAALSTFRYFAGLERPLPRRIHLSVRKMSLILITLALLTSIAIFLGNGKTNLRNASGTLYLNHYAQYFAISAGLIQILVFLGRDRLFRSERGESKQWQKYVQQGVTTVVLLFLTFSMVHWMGREDISEYTVNRDPHLVRGDVTDWYVMDQLFSAYEAHNSEQPMAETDSSKLNPIDNVPDYVRPQSRWIEYLAAGRLGLFGLDTLSPHDLERLQPPSPQQSPEGIESIWSLPKRLYGAVIAYGLAMWHGEDEHFQVDLSLPEEQSIRATVHKAFDDIKKTNDEQELRLQKWNKELEKPQFTAFLLDGMQGTPTDLSPSGNASSSKPIGKNGYIAVSDRVSKLLDSTNAQITSSERNRLLNAVRRLQLVKQSAVRSDLASEQSKTATANRLLLEAFFPGAVQQYDIPSTLVVPPHDQRARLRGLGFWMMVALVGLIGGLGPYRIATVFQFYRRQLGSNFLVATHDPSQKSSDKELHELRPTDDGLPYPLMLAATLEPSTRNGSYRVEAEPFVFSPMYSGRFDTAATPIPSKQLSFSLNAESRGVTLGDAITLSGAAVTPLMTGNRWLSVILDFFNTGIGQRVRRVDRSGGIIEKKSKLPVVISFLAGIAVLFAAIMIVGLGWLMSLLAMLTTWLLAYCIVMRVGSPGLIRSLIIPRKGEGHDDDRPSEDNCRSFYVADGGYCDYLGVSELLRRRCELIVVSDAGANIGDDSLGTLARMCENAAQEMGIRFLDLDHEAPIDFGRLEKTDQRLVHQPYLCMRIRYPDPHRKEGLLFYCQMSITDSDPIEIQHIRNLFPSFPDEPTVNQFYSEIQVAAYRSLGYHIANRLCNELQCWQVDDQGDVDQDVVDQDVVDQDRQEQPQPQSSDLQTSPQEPAKVRRFEYSLVAGRRASMFDGEPPPIGHQGQPLFRVLKERLLTAYRLACYEELSYRKDDIFSEAIWPTATFAFPTFRASVMRVAAGGRGEEHLPNRWLREYECSADVRSAYRTAVINDINSLDIGTDCLCAVLWSVITKITEQNTSKLTENLLAAHLTNISTACQEVHRGRPHSAFQIGGRDKLIHLCRSVSRVICKTLQTPIIGCPEENLLADMDRVIAQLIELERSVFQGGEHVTTISFAQCMSAMWGRIARGDLATDDVDEDTARGMVDMLLGSEVSSNSESADKEKSPALRVAELRSQLDVGLRKMQLRLVRNSLAKSWYLGYFKTDEITDRLEFKERPPSKRKRTPRKAKAGSAKTARRRKAAK